MEFGAVTHAFAGVLTVDVLISWTLVGLWLLVREPLPALLGCGAPRARVHVVTVGRWGTRLVPAIGRDRVAGVPLFSLLQYGSSVGGAVVITLFAVRALRCAPGGAAVGVPVLSVRGRWWAGAVIGGCAAAGAVQRAARWWALTGAPERPWDLVPAPCFGVGAGLVLGLVLYAVGVRVWRRGPVPDGSGTLRDPGDPDGPDGPGDPGGVVDAGRGRPVGR